MHLHIFIFFQNLMDEEESMADLLDENGKSICNDLEKLTALPWKIPQGIIGNPLQCKVSFNR